MAGQYLPRLDGNERGFIRTSSAQVCCGSFYALSEGVRILSNAVGISYAMLSIMKISCIDRFTEEDLEFIVGVLGQQSEAQADGIRRMWEDSQSRLELLDFREIYEALVEGMSCLKVSSAFYFTIISRKFLKEAGMDEWELAEYLGAMLERFMHTPQLYAYGNPQYGGKTLPGAIDFLDKLAGAKGATSYVIQVHVGNYSLFVTGMLKEKLQHNCSKHGAPDIGFYEMIGKSYYEIASHHKLAAKDHLDHTFIELSEGFHEIRCLLNEMSERVFHHQHPGIPLVRAGEESSAIHLLS